MSAARASEIVIAAGAPGDLDGLLALENEAFDHDRLTRRQLRHALVAPSLTLVVARRGPLVAGYVLVEHRQRSRFARLTSLAVSSRARGLGLGRALIAEAERIAARAGRELLRLEVKPRNRAARTLYESLGFRRFDSVPNYYEDGGTAWRYEKRLMG